MALFARMTNHASAYSSLVQRCFILDVLHSHLAHSYMEPDEAERAQDAEHVQDAVAEHDQDAEHDQGAVAEPGEGAPAEDEVETFRVTQVTMVSLIVGAQKSPKTWMPDTSMVSGMQFAHVSKWDSAWVRLCTGKGLVLRKNNALAVRLWQEICSERARFTSQSFPLCKVC